MCVSSEMMIWAGDKSGICHPPREGRGSWLLSCVVVKACYSLIGTVGSCPFSELFPITRAESKARVSLENSPPGDRGKKWWGQQKAWKSTNKLTQITVLVPPEEAVKLWVGEVVWGRPWLEIVCF